MIAGGGRWVAVGPLGGNSSFLADVRHASGDEEEEDHDGDDHDE